jgi:hypothetical protein
MKDSFRYFNPNPSAKVDKKTGKPKRWNKGDCVIRAFCGVLNLPWDIVYSEMCDLGLKYHDMPNSRNIIDKYAKKKGLIKKSLPYYITLNDFVKNYDGIYLVNLRSHEVCVKGNTIYDCWDCGDCKVKTYYDTK